MMDRKGLLLALGAMALLAGCGGEKRGDVRTGGTTVDFVGLGDPEAGGAEGESAQTVAITTPGFAAKLNMPGIDFGGGIVIDGMALHPGARVVGLKVVGAAGDGSGGEGHGTVDLRFTDPAAPAQVVAYYRQSAPGAGWQIVPPAAGQQFAATKAKADGSEHLALYLGAAGPGGSSGRFVISGS